jgi:type II secretory pathway pseudopilin PulG
MYSDQLHFLSNRRSPSIHGRLAVGANGIHPNFEKLASLIRDGASVIEVLSVVGVISILCALLLPAVNSAREAGRRLKCQSNLRQIGLAIQSFHSSHGRAPQPKAILIHWHVELLPQLEHSSHQLNIQRELDQGVSWMSLREMNSPISVLKCPSDPLSPEIMIHDILQFPMATTNYVGIVGENREKNNGLFPHRPTSKIRPIRFRDVTDGLSNTFSICEHALGKRAVSGAWLASAEFGSQSIGVNNIRWDSSVMYPGTEICDGMIYSHGDNSVFCDQFRPWSFHGVGANFVRCDGSLDLVSYGIDRSVIVALSTISDGDANGLTQ